MRHPMSDGFRQCGEETFVFKAQRMDDDGNLFIVHDGRDISLADRETLLSLLRQQLKGH